MQFDRITCDPNRNEDIAQALSYAAVVDGSIIDLRRDERRVFRPAWLARK